MAYNNYFNYTLGTKLRNVNKKFRDGFYHHSFSRLMIMNVFLCLHMKAVFRELLLISETKHLYTWFI